MVLIGDKTLSPNHILPTKGAALYTRSSCQRHICLRPFPAEPMRMWPISTRVNKPENDEPSLLEPIALAPSAA
jgi:hypothetical protein